MATPSVGYGDSSRYIIARDPARFGHQQEDYENQSEAVVKEGCAKISQFITEGRDLNRLFHEILSSMATARHCIATKHLTAQPHLYGQLRHSPRKEFNITAITGLYYPYQEYNDKLLPKLQEYLRSMRHTLREFEQTDLTVTYPVCLGRVSSMDIHYINPDLTRWQAEMNLKEECRKLCEIAGKPCPETDIERKAIKQELMADVGVIEQFKKRYPDDF